MRLTAHGRAAAGPDAVAAEAEADTIAERARLDAAADHVQELEDIKHAERDRVAINQRCCVTSACLSR